MKTSTAKAVSAKEIWFGRPGHFIGAAQCRFHLHTHVNRKWCISTVGEYIPHGKTSPVEIGLEGLYETMVFALSPSGEIASWSSLESASYNTPEAADSGHAAMLSKWKRKKKITKSGTKI